MVMCRRDGARAWPTSSRRSPTPSATPARPGSGRLGRLEPGVAFEDPLGLRGPPFTAEVGVHGTGSVERRLHDSPGLLDHILACEAARLAGHRVVEQAFVRLATLAESSGEVDGDIDVLAVEMGTRRLGLQCERDAVLRPEAEAHEVAAGRWPTGLVEQQARRLSELDDDLGRRLLQRLAGSHVPR